jgi:hypothetical protein
MLNVSSGKLSCNNIFCLDEHVRDRMLIDDKEKKQKQLVVHERKEQQKQKQQQTFKNAAIEYFGGRNLVATDLRLILKHTSQRTDSPIRPKVLELRDQFHRRRSRMDLYNNANTAAQSAHNGENESKNENSLGNIFLPNS